MSVSGKYSARYYPGGVKPQCLNLIKMYQTCKLWIHQLIPYAFDCLWSVSEGCINEQERYYYFNRRHQEIKPCGRLCEWREEVRVTVYVCACLSTCFFSLVCAQKSTPASVNVCTYKRKCVSLCICVCDYIKQEKDKKKQKYEIEKLIKEEEGKNFFVCILTHLRASWCDFACVCVCVCVCVCQWLSLKSEEKRFIFPCLCFIQQDTHIHRPKTYP